MLKSTLPTIPEIKDAILEIATDGRLRDLEKVRRILIKKFNLMPQESYSKPFKQRVVNAKYQLKEGRKLADIRGYIQLRSASAVRMIAQGKNTKEYPLLNELQATALLAFAEYAFVKGWKAKESGEPEVHRAYRFSYLANETISIFNAGIVALTDKDTSSCGSAYQTALAAIRNDGDPGIETLKHFEALESQQN